MSIEKGHPDGQASISVNSVQFRFDDIRKVVDTFYARVATDKILGPPFSSVHDWPHHIERLTHFWWIRFGGEPYLDVTYNPVEKHFTAGFNDEFLTRWLALFQGVLDETLEPPQAKFWSDVAHRMGFALTMKNELYKEHLERMA